MKAAAATRLLPLLAIIPACALSGDDGSSVTQAISGTASINLSSSSAAVTLTSDAQWSLTKTGSISGNTVTWTITATKTATVSGQLVVQGQMTVGNSGSGPATIGNIVANLQTRVNNTWKSAAADVADATNGDSATTAKIHAAASSENKGSFSESAGSGKLEFMDATNNTVFSLVPEVTIGAGQSRTLLFQATYNNNVLHLATGTPIRAEVIVSFGNATLNGNATSNVDINGNGSIDWDEARIRSVPTRLGLGVPQQTAGNTTPTLSDALGDITTTGTASHGSVWFNLGATSGTVSTTVDGGASGGTITNCAHLKTPGQTIANGGFTFTQVGALNLEACNTQTIGATTCTPGAPGCGWHSHDRVTYDQDTWGSSSSAAGALLTASYNTVYAPLGGLEIGVPGTSGHSMYFSSDGAVFAYLPQIDSPGVLNADLSDPTSSSSGSLGGNVLALRLNVDLSSGIGGMLICGVSEVPAVNGQTVSQFLATAQTILGGTAAPYSPGAADAVAALVNSAFVGGAPSTFAQDHLFTGSCP